MPVWDVGIDTATAPNVAPLRAPPPAPISASHWVAAITASLRWLPGLARATTLSPSRPKRQTPAGRPGGRGHDRVGLSERDHEARMPRHAASVCGKSRFYVTGARRDT